MRIHVDVTGPTPATTLHDRDEFGAFDVEVSGDEAAAGPSLVALGSWTAGGGHVFVEVEKLIELAGDHGRDPAWRSSLQTMLDYAAEHGWVDEAGRVRAHIIGCGA